MEALQQKRRIRVLIGKPGLDGHDRGAKVVAAALRDAGMEVVYSGLRASVDALAAAAVQEGVDVIGLSVLSGAHEVVCRRLFALLAEKGARIPVVLGGVIPDADYEKLYALGVAAIFGPESPLSAVTGAVQALAEGGEVDRPMPRGKPRRPPIAQIDHVAICVRDLDKVIPSLEKVFGLTLAHRELVAPQKTEAAFIDFGADTALEIITPRGNDGLEKFLARRGDALHHLALRVSNLAEGLVALEAEGIELIDKVPRPGARGHRVAFIHPRSTGGLLVELVEHP